MSNGKCRTIEEFRTAYLIDPDPIDSWSALSYEELLTEVQGFWGMSHWTASILALFHFAHEDIFPNSDASLQKAAKLIEIQYPKNFLDPEACRPYRSYLALALWAGLDSGKLDSN